MNIIEQVYAATVLWWVGLDKFPITSGTTAVFVATFWLMVLKVGQCENN